MSSWTWILEPDVQPCHERLSASASRVGQAVRTWDERWLAEGWPELEGTRVLFHGSLAHADRVAREAPWEPGAFCRTDSFRCSHYLPKLGDLALNETWRVLPAAELAADPASALNAVGAGGRAFVRPDSPLKPFAGRVLDAQAISLEALDHGFYYEDVNLPVLVAPVREVGRESRFVVVAGRVVAGSAYDPERRVALPDDPASEAWQFAQAVATRPGSSLEDVYVLDACETPDGHRILELNPFSGADLYACELDDLVAAIAELPD